MTETSKSWARVVQAAGRGLYRREYAAEFTDRHYRATAPLEPETCRCTRPGPIHDEAIGEITCWKCGRPIANTPKTIANH